MKKRVDSEELKEILRINEHLSHINDIDSLLERVLTEVRKFTNADAGSIYLIHNDQLTFEHVQNDTLMAKNRDRNKYIYKKQALAIDNNSISGYVAKNMIPLTIDDVYKLGGTVPYLFNRSFDTSGDYHTKSVLTVPLITSYDKVIGVVQIINAKDKNNKIIPFTDYDQHLVLLFANQAAVSIERARITREIILRMIKIAELRDPQETASHVNRVGAYSIEIYHRWAEKNNLSEDEIRRTKDILRISAMLHDVGKVAISDTILKKNRQLNKDEFSYMKLHTVFGARLFTNAFSDWDKMAAEISLNHHEKWDGSGYPGPVNDIFAKDITPLEGKTGPEIPFFARIVCLADVYDALISNRSYKRPWPEERALDYIHTKTGSHFDPEITAAFFDIYEVIKAIKGKYPG